MRRAAPMRVYQASILRYWRAECRRCWWTSGHDSQQEALKAARRHCRDKDGAR